MPDMTEQMGNQVLKLGGSMIKGSAEFIEELLKMLEKNRLDDPMKNTIYEHIKAGRNCTTSFIKDADTKDLDRYLAEEGVAWTYMELPNDNSKLLIVRDIDKEKAEFAAKRLLAERGLVTEFEKHELLKITPQNKLAVVSGLDIAEYELFREKAKDNALQFAATIDEKGVVSILYNVDDREKADIAVKQMSWDMTGDNGKSFREAYKAKAEAQELISDLYAKDLSDIKGVYILDANHPERVLKIGKNGVALCEKYDATKTERENFDVEEIEKISIKDPEYKEKLQEVLEKIEQPVALKIQNMKEKEKELADKMPKLNKERKAMEYDFRTIFEEEFSMRDESSVGLQQDTSAHKVIMTTKIQNKIKDNNLNPDEIKAVEAHVQEASDLTKKYTMHMPKEKVIDKVIEHAKNQKAINEAKRDFERTLGREMGKELKKRNKGQEKAE